MIYLDYCATTPMSETALEMYNKVAKDFYGNPSSLHDIGTTSKQILDASREELAKCFNGEARGVYFTGGGSEANNLAIRSLLKGNQKKGRHLITTKIEHSSLLNTFEMLESEGYDITYVPVNEYGEVTIDTLDKALSEDTILVSISHASSEIGTIQNIEQIGCYLAEKDILFHSDCVQSFGKIPLDVKKAKLSALSISSHKLYGPKGVGACYISPSVSWQSVIPNTTHEKGFVPGTVNVPGIASFVTAAQEICNHLDKESLRLVGLREQLYETLSKEFPRVILEGHPTNRLPHHLGLRISGMEGQYAMLECNRYGLAISTGTACQIGQTSPSKALLALGRSKQEAIEFIRISLGRFTTEEDINEALCQIRKIIVNYF
ncbi:IscS subfamily cysteine desulfurase [Anaerobacillus sp. MEB173]|uniref:IscS subfamily cysteine desulfurase n=1 Tax=Anaerobacillus sp. MEB173 TaxID=3383345 RepID=UPI003F91D000